MKIIRVSNETHAEFKKLCKTNKVTLNQGAEKLIQYALKNGAFKDPPKSVFQKLKEIESLFRSWMKTQEKVHLDRINEDLLSLSRNLKDLGTKGDIDNAIESSFSRVQNSINESYNDLKNDYRSISQGYYELLEYQKGFREKLLRRIKYSGIHVSIALFVLAGSFFISDSFTSQTDKGLEYKLIQMKYDKLYEFCEEVEATYDIKFLDSYDAWLDTSKVLMKKQLKKEGHVSKDY